MVHARPSPAPTQEHRLARTRRRGHPQPAARASEMVILLGLARRTARQIEKASPFYSFVETLCPACRRGVARLWALREATPPIVSLDDTEHAAIRASLVHRLEQPLDPPRAVVVSDATPRRAQPRPGCTVPLAPEFLPGVESPAVDLREVLPAAAVIRTRAVAERVLGRDRGHVHQPHSRRVGGAAVVAPALVRHAGGEVPRESPVRLDLQLRDHEVPVRLLSEMVILLGLARRTANKSEKVSLFYVGPMVRVAPAGTKNM